MATTAPFPPLAPVRRRAVSQMAVEPLLQRWEGMKSQRTTWEFDWQDGVNLMLPGADDILTYRAPGQSRTEFIYDTTALMAPQTLAANLMGSVTNSALQWFRTKFRNEDLQRLQAVNQWLQQCDVTMLAAYNASNFYQAAHTYYLNLGVFGTAAMMVEGYRSRLGTHLSFHTLPTGSYTIAENSIGKVDTLYRECWFTPRQAYQMFGEGLSRAAMAAYQQPSLMDKPQKYLHAVFPRQERQRGRIDNKNMSVVSIYMDYDGKEIVQESGYEEFPFLVSRWETMSQSPYGFGPGHLALPDIRTVNELTRLNLEQLTLWARPPLRVLDKGIIGQISLQPYALNVVTQHDALQPLELTGRPDLVQINRQELQASINNIFYVQALQALPRPEDGQMTAYEVAQRIDQMQRLMGPAFHRLLAEMLDPLADRVFGLLLRAGAFPRPPLEVLYAAAQAQGQLDIEYEGPLARAQRGADLNAILQGYSMGAQIAQATGDLAVWDVIDIDESFRHGLLVGGYPRSLIKDARDVMLMRQARAQAQQQAVQQQQMHEAMASVGRVAPAITAFQQAREASQSHQQAVAA